MMVHWKVNWFRRNSSATIFKLKPEKMRNNEEGTNLFGGFLVGRCRISRRYVSSPSAITSPSMVSLSLHNQVTKKKRILVACKKSRSLLFCCKRCRFDVNSARRLIPSELQPCHNNTRCPWPRHPESWYHIVDLCRTVPLWSKKHWRNLFVSCCGDAQDMIIVKTERCYITIIIIIIIISSSSIIIENKIDWFPGLCHGNPQWLHHLHFVTCGLPFRHHGKYRCCVCCPLTPPFLISWISRNMPSKHSKNPYSYFLGIGLTRVPAQKWLYSAESRLGNQKSRIENHF